MLKQMLLTIAAVSVLALTTGGFSDVVNADDNTKGEAAPPAATTPPAEKVDRARKSAFKRRKNHKKRKKARQSPEAESIPQGEKLSLKQVLDLAKSTRDLSGRNLSGLQLIGANLSKCNLKGADLSRANLERADLSESNLERADLAGANLRMASLREAGMVAANLDMTIFDGAIWKDGSICAKNSIGPCRAATTLVSSPPLPETSVTANPVAQHSKPESSHSGTVPESPGSATK